MKYPRYQLLISRCCCCCCKPCCCPCCCGGRRKRALLSAHARGALGNAALVPRVNEPRTARSCGQCQCQDCKATPAIPAVKTGSSPAAFSVPQQRQYRQCTPEEEKQCLAMMAAQKQASNPPSSLVSNLYRKFKRAISLAKQSSTVGGCETVTGGCAGSCKN